MQLIESQAAAFEGTGVLDLANDTDVEGSSLTVVLPITQYDEEHFVFMATAMGTVMSRLARARKALSELTGINPEARRSSP